MIFLSKHQTIFSKDKPKRLRKAKVLLLPDSEERDFRRFLRGLVAFLKEETAKILLPELRNITASAPELVSQDAVNLDQGFARKVATLVIALRRSFDERYPDRVLREQARKTGEGVAGKSRAETAKVLASIIGQDVLTPQSFVAEAMEGFVESNVSLIRTIPEKLFSDIEGQVFSGVRQGLRHEQISAVIQDRFGVAEANADRIARDQTTKFYGQLNMLTQESAGISRYVWRTALDERVRPEHERREGKTFSWDDPPEDGHPGEPINCRCTAEPVLEGLL